jgi:hypothetical protein
MLNLGALQFINTDLISLKWLSFESCSWQGVLDTALCNLQQIGGFIWAFLLPPSIKLTATI